MSAIETLSPRERQVLELLAQAKSNEVIATQLGIQLRTVEHHCENLYRKLDACDAKWNRRVRAVIAWRQAA